MIYYVYTIRKCIIIHYYRYESLLYDIKVEEDSINTKHIEIEKLYIFHYYILDELRSEVM